MAAKIKMAATCILLGSKILMLTLEKVHDLSETWLKYIFFLFFCMPLYENIPQPIFSLNPALRLKLYNIQYDCSDKKIEKLKLKHCFDFFLS
jgi:hypothetical protein